MENDLLVFPGLFGCERGYPFHWFSFILCEQFHVFCMLVFVAIVDLRHRMDTLDLSSNISVISVYQSKTTKQ